jgi:hypothetical protein
MLESFHRHALCAFWRSARTPEAEFRAITQAMKELGRRHGFDGPAASSMKAATVAQGRKFSG